MSLARQTLDREVTSPSKKSKERGQICENFRYRASCGISRLVNGEPARGLFMGLNPGLYIKAHAIKIIKILFIYKYLK